MFACLFQTIVAIFLITCNIQTQIDKGNLFQQHTLTNKKTNNNLKYKRPNKQNKQTIVRLVFTI